MLFPLKIHYMEELYKSSMLDSLQSMSQNVLLFSPSFNEILYIHNICKFLGVQCDDLIPIDIGKRLPQQG